MANLDQQRELIQDDLRGLVAGEVLCAPVYLQLFASDGSVYEIRPIAVVRPHSVEDVVACVQYAADKQLPIHARGSGTRVAGAAIGPGLVLDFSRFLRRILHVDEGTVTVQPGVVHERLNAFLRPHGRMFAPDPDGSSVTTIGGMIGVDAAGSRRLKYGSTQRHLLSLQVVLANGRLMRFAQEPILASPAVADGPTPLANRVADLLTRHAEQIEKSHRARPLSCGYRLHGLWDGDRLNLAQLMAGSEGTLGLVTEATLSTVELPRARGAALLLFDGLEKAARTALDLTHYAPSACDLMDRRRLGLLRTDSRFEALIPAEAEALLLVEQEGDDPLEVRRKIQQMVDEVRHQNRRAFAARQAFDPAEVELFWQLTSGFQTAVYRLKGPSRPVPMLEDLAVPPDALPEFLIRLQNLLKRHELMASVFCHVALGHVRMRPFVDLTNPTEMAKMPRLAEDLYRELFDLGGAAGGENGCGLSRTPFLRQQDGALYEVFRELKQIFDPAGILNPGKIIGDDTGQLIRDLRPSIVRGQETSQTTAESDVGQTIEPTLRNLVELQLNWDAQRVAAAADPCNGCGHCRTQEPGVRMCPLFRLTPAEESTPRAKASLLRGVLTGRLDLGCLTSDDFKQVADLCVHCHMCRLECPAGVDIPRLMRESKGAHVAANGLRLPDWVVTHLDLIDALGSLVAPLANWALANRQMRWFLEKTLGIAQGRKLPRVVSRCFLRRAFRRRLTRISRRAGQKVVYFTDLYANYHDPQLAEALVAVLEHNGVHVYVPLGQRQAGMPAIARGSLDYARALAHHNVALLAEAVRQGYHVVATEPAAALCLVREYPQLVDDDDARLVAANTSEACTYLWRLHTLGKLQLDFKPVHTSLGYHMPCHLKALEAGAPGKSLLQLVPGLQIHDIEEGCSGMAGTFGLQRKNYRTSLRAGWGLIARLRNPEILAGTTECSACKIQMEQGTTKPTVHPLKILALAYGLMPELAPLLTTPGEELIVS
jgi:FAD/FMN-containing dehydrogenase/Fe-S oxidoreductase